jgi:hypothetical protein
MYVWACQAGAGTLLAPYIPTTNVARAVSSPYVDANAGGTIEDPFAYLCQESGPTGTDKGFAGWSRLYARIPKQLVTYSTMAITKPSAPNQDTASPLFYYQGAGDYTAPSIGYGSVYNDYYYPPNNTIFGPTRTGTIPTLTVASSGQFRVKYKTSTTANLNYNDADATIEAAINGLADVIADGIVVSVNNYFLTAGNGALEISLTSGNTSNPFIIDANSFNAGATKLFSWISTSTLQYISIGWQSTITAHGFSSSAALMAGCQYPDGSNVRNMVGIQPQAASLLSGSWAVVDANAIAIDPSVTASTGNSVSLFNTFGAYLRAYTPGPDRVGVKLVQDFYLPGVTTGITTAADIPVPDPLINDTAFLAAAVANTSGYLTYDSDPLTFWNGPIYTQVKQQINMADV